MNGKVTHFRTTVIHRVLNRMGSGGAAAEELLLGTAVQESLCFTYRRQMGSGPALGYYQMEPATHDDIGNNYLKYRPSVGELASSFLTGKSVGSAALEFNDDYATAMARVHSRRVSAPLPKAGDVAAQARYWKRFYNTVAGQGRASEYVEKWNKCVARAAA